MYLVPGSLIECPWYLYTGLGLVRTLFRGRSSSARGTYTSRPPWRAVPSLSDSTRPPTASPRASPGYPSRPPVQEEETMFTEPRRQRVRLGRVPLTKLGPVYIKRQYQRCDNASDTVLSWKQWSHSRLRLQPIFEWLHCFQWEQCH